MAAKKNKYIELRQERDFGQVISTTFDFLFANFVGFFKTVFAITGATFVFSMGILSLWLYRFINGYSASVRNYNPYRGYNSSVDTLLNMFGGYNLIYFSIALVVLFISFLLTYLTIYTYVKIYVEKGRLSEITLNEVWSAVKKKLGKYIAAGLVYSFFFIVVYAAVIYAVTIISSLIFFLMLGFFALVYYCYLYFTIIVNEENVNVIDAFARSFYLVKGKWWFTFGVYFVTYLLCYVLTLFLSVGIGSLVTVVRNLFDMDDYKYLFIAFGTSFAVLGVIYFYMIFCFFIIKNCVLYYSFVELKDSTGLLEKIHAIGYSPENGEAQTIKTEINKQHYSNEEAEEDF